MSDLRAYLAALVAGTAATQTRPAPAGSLEIGDAIAECANASLREHEGTDALLPPSSLLPPLP